MKLRNFVTAFVAVLVLALATPVAAQYELQRALQGTFDAAHAGTNALARNMCADHQHTGDLTEASWCYGLVVSPSTHRVTGYNTNAVYGPGSRYLRIGDYYQNPYDRRGYGPDVDISARTMGTIVGGGAGAALTEHRSGWQKAGAIVAGAILGNVVGKKLDSRGRERVTGEKPSDCVKRTMKEFDKRKTSVSAEQVIALCGGGTAPEMTQESPEPIGTPNVDLSGPEILFIDGFLCNNSESDITVKVDGTPRGVLKAHRKVPLSNLAGGTITWSINDQN